MQKKVSIIHFYLKDNALIFTSFIFIWMRRKKRGFIQHFNNMCNKSISQ